MPLLIAIDISLSNLMLVGPLTNTQKTYFAQLLYKVQYDGNISFCSDNVTDVHQLSLCSPYPVKEAL